MSIQTYKKIASSKNKELFALIEAQKQFLPLAVEYFFTPEITHEQRAFIVKVFARLRKVTKLKELRGPVRNIVESLDPTSFAYRSGGSSATDARFCLLLPTILLLVLDHWYCSAVLHLTVLGQNHHRNVIEIKKKRFINVNMREFLYT